MYNLYGAKNLDKSPMSELLKLLCEKNSNVVIRNKDTFILVKSDTEKVELCDYSQTTTHYVDGTEACGVIVNTEESLEDYKSELVSHYEKYVPTYSEYELAIKAGVPSSFISLLVGDTDTIEIRDANGQIFNTVKEVSVIYDNSVGTMLKIGEYSELEEHFTKIVDSLTADRTNAAESMIRALRFARLPNNQELVDKVFQNTGFLSLLIKRITALAAVGFSPRI